MSNLIMAMSTESTLVPSGQYISIYTQDTATATQTVGGTTTALGTVTQSQQTYGPFAAATTVTITSGAYTTVYNVGSGVPPAIRELIGNSIQRTPALMNTAGAIPFATLAAGLITSNSLLGISCTLPLGTAIDAARDFKTDDSFDWVVIVIGLFGFTVAGSTGHTVVGNATIASGTSGTFRTRKTAAATFVTYRIA